MLELEADFNFQKDHPSQLAILNLQKTIFQDHPYRYPILVIKNITKSIEFSDLENEFYKFRDGSDWVIGGAGSFPVEQVADKLKDAFKKWKRNSEDSFALNNEVKNSPLSEIKTIEMDKEQCHILLGRLGVSWGDEDRSTLDVIMNALGGSGEDCL